MSLPAKIAACLCALVILIYLGICVALFAYQRSLIYFPQPRGSGTAGTTFRLQVPGADLVVTLREVSGPKALLYFGGNAEDVAGTLPALAQAFPERAIYLMHYRGYGGSSGLPSEEDIRNDALALFDRIHQDHADIVVMGRSLGSGVAVRLASQRPASRLVLITPYDSIQEIAAAQYPYVPVRWLLRDKYESAKYAPAIGVPALLIAAEHDELIPEASTRRLLASFRPGIASLVVVKGSGHNTILESQDYLQALAEGS